MGSPRDYYRNGRQITFGLLRKSILACFTHSQRKEETLQIIIAKGDDLTPERVAQIEAFMNQGFKREKIPRVFYPENFVRIYSKMIDMGVGVLFLLLDDRGEVVGLLGGVVSPALLTKNIVAQETSWRVGRKGKGWGMRLLEMFEAWAEQVAEADMVLVNTRDDVEEFLRLKGKLEFCDYQVSGHQFMKRIKKSSEGGV